MKIRIWDRLIAALTGLVLVMAALGLFVFGLGIFPFKLDLSAWADPLTVGQRIVVIVSALIALALGLHSMSFLLRRRKDKGFVIQHTEYGDMSISMKALESMAAKCAEAHTELEVKQIRIHLARGGINVDVKVILANGINIPLTVNAVQKRIKQYITSCSGVDVQEVRVMVETDAARLAPPEAVVTPEEDISPEPLYQPVEEPVGYPSAQEPVAAAAVPEEEKTQEEQGLADESEAKEDET